MSIQIDIMEVFIAIVVFITAADTMLADIIIPLPILRLPCLPVWQSGQLFLRHPCLQAVRQSTSMEYPIKNVTGDILNHSMRATRFNTELSILRTDFKTSLSFDWKEKLFCCFSDSRLCGDPEFFCCTQSNLSSSPRSL